MTDTDLAPHREEQDRMERAHSEEPYSQIEKPYDPEDYLVYWDDDCEDYND